MELSIVIPTFNEKNNIEPLIIAIHKTVVIKATWEIIFVDDNSPDGTYSHIQKLANKYKNIRCLRRINRRGLSSASIEGILSSSADFFMIMDADLQHDETIIPKMFNVIKKEKFDLVIGSRFIDGGSAAQGMINKRLKISNFATMLSRLIVKVKLADPMSGFFIVSRKFFEANVNNLSAIGFKVLLDLIASSTSVPKFCEIPYKMQKRASGVSKLDAVVVWEYVLLLIDKTIGRYIPIRFAMFLFVGFSGIFVHLLVLRLVTIFFGYSFIVAQSIATIVAMTTNYVFNNFFTYRDKKLIGKKFFKGLFSFYAACFIGFLININLAQFLFDISEIWWLSGFLGAAVSSIWNYGATKHITWR